MCSQRKNDDMRFLRIFLLNFQRVIQIRSRAFVWLLLAFINPLISLVFWAGVLNEKGNILEGWVLPTLTTYYFLIIVLGSILISHIEEDVAEYDIREGGLVKFIIRPVSYFFMKMIEELPWRIMQGGFGILVFLILITLFGNFLSLSITTSVISALIISILAFLISFTFKMLIGISAFWLTEFRGLQQMLEVLGIILAGFVMPIDLFPNFLKTIALLTPFPYIIYYPVIAFQGRLSDHSMIQVISTQIVMLVILYFIYRILWRVGLRKFTGVGQ